MEGGGRRRLEMVDWDMDLGESVGRVDERLVSG